MSPHRQNPFPEERQFRLVKFFAYASFIVLIIFSFPFSVIISQKAKDILMKSYENYALLVGQNLNHQVFQNFSIPVYNRFGEIKLRDRQQWGCDGWRGSSRKGFRRFSWGISISPYAKRRWCAGSACSWCRCCCDLRR